MDITSSSWHLPDPRILVVAMFECIVRAVFAFPQVQCRMLPLYVYKRKYLESVRKLDVVHMSHVKLIQLEIQMCGCSCFISNASRKERYVASLGLGLNLDPSSLAVYAKVYCCATSDDVLKRLRM